MTSAIDPTKPTAGNALTADVRQNFQTAADEISALQNSGPIFLAVVKDLDLTVAGDTPIPVQSDGQDYIVTDLYLANRSGGDVNSGFMGIYTQPDKQGLQLISGGLNLTGADGITHWSGNNFDSNWLSQAMLYLNMDGPANPPALADLYLIGFRL
jgi:hypothetical protein